MGVLMRVSIYQQDELQYQPLDLRHLTEPEATELCLAIRQTLLPYATVWHLCDLSNRCENLLRRHRIRTVGEVQDMTLTQWQKLSGWGPTTYRELQTAMKGIGIELHNWED